MKHINKDIIKSYKKYRNKRVKYEIFLKSDNYICSNNDTDFEQEDDADDTPHDGYQNVNNDKTVSLTTYSSNDSDNYIIEHKTKFNLINELNKIKNDIDKQILNSYRQTSNT